MTTKRKSKSAAPPPPTEVCTRGIAPPCACAFCNPPAPPAVVS